LKRYSQLLKILNILEYKPENKAFYIHKVKVHIDSINLSLVMLN